MTKIIGCLLALGLLFSPRAFAEDDQLVWLSKPVLCGDTTEVLKSLENSGFKRIAKSTIVRNNDEQIIGNLYYMTKDDDLVIIEIFHEKSCMISFSKYFMIFKQKNENEL
jgi:hypothetical protein